MKNPVNIIMLKTECFPPEIRKIRMFTLATGVQHYTGGHCKAIRQETEIYRIHSEKREIKTTFADDIISHTENTKESTKKLTELINGFSKVQDQYAKINCISIH